VLSLTRTTRLDEITYRHQRLAADLAELRSTIFPQLERGERDLMAAKLDRLFAEFHIALQLMLTQGLESAAAVENGPRNGRSFPAREGRWDRSR
jgi:hypothetical protein